MTAKTKPTRKGVIGPNSAENLSCEFDFLKNRFQNFYLLGEKMKSLIPSNSRKNISGDLFDLYQDKSDFYLVSKVTEEDFWRDIFWKQRRELFGLFEEIGCENYSDSLVKIAEKSCLVSIGCQVPTEIYYDKVIDLSNQHFIDNMKGYLGGKVYLPG